MNKIITSFGKLIKSNDRFSTPISLNYLGETSFKTVIGGLSSIAIGISLLWYLWIMISEMVNRQNSVVNSATKMNSLILDPTSYNVGDSKFMFTLYSPNFDSNFYKILDSSYFSLNMIQYKTTKSMAGIGKPSQTATSLDYAYWDDRFDNTLGSLITQAFPFNLTICPKTIDLSVGGNYLATEFNYFTIELKKCSGKSYWK